MSLLLIDLNSLNILNALIFLKEKVKIHDYNKSDGGIFEIVDLRKISNSTGDFKKRASNWGWKC